MRAIIPVDFTAESLEILTKHILRNNHRRHL